MMVVGLLRVMLDDHRIGERNGVLDLCNSTVPHYIQHHGSDDEYEAEQDE